MSDQIVKVYASQDWVDEKISELSDQIVDLDGLTYGIYVGDTEPTNGVMYWLDTSGDAESGGDDTEVTLSSISATYTGGDVTVGTALTDLTGITVTAHYSDGSTETVTGYTLSGEIVEGSNTITITYNGLITTFTVTGVAESGGESGGLDLSESNVFASVYADGSSTSLIISSDTGTPSWDDFMNLDVEKLYFYNEIPDQYKKKMVINAAFTSGWGSSSVANNVTIAQATDGTYEFITNAWDKFDDSGYIIFEIDVPKFQAKIQSMYDDGTLDSTKIKRIEIKNSISTVVGSTLYLLYNYNS